MRSVSVGLAVLASVCLAGPAITQDVADYRRARDSVAETLRARTEAWERAVVAQRRAARASARSETLVSGVFHAQVEPRLVKFASRTLARANDGLRSQLGPGIETVPRHAFSLGTPRERGSGEGTVLLFDSTGRPAGRYTADADVVASVLRANALRPLADRMPHSLRAWRRPARPVPVLGTVDWRAARAAIAASDAVPAQACMRGERAACAVALELTEVTDPVMEWHDAPARARLVVAHSRTLAPSARAQLERCVAGGPSAICDSLARALPVSAVPRPVGDPARAALLALALQTEGDPAAAMQRLLDATGSIREVLETTAGVPADSLVAAWQARIDVARAGTLVSPWLTASALFWAALCAALSLRSSRWR